MPTLITTLLSLLPLTAALPSLAPRAATYNGTTYSLGTHLSFNQSSFPFTNNIFFSADISPVSSEPGACYPHTYETAYFGASTASLLNFTTTHATKASGRTPVNALNIGGEECWGLEIEQGVLVVRQGVGAGMKGWYVEEAVLGHDGAPNGFYYCYDSTGHGIVGVEDKKKTHAGSVYSVCFETVLSAFATPS